jgi:hypothetical protein
MIPALFPGGLEAPKWPIAIARPGNYKIIGQTTVAILMRMLIERLAIAMEGAVLNGVMLRP